MLQDSEPDLPGENAHDQQVINSFLNLFTKRTSRWVGKTFLAKRTVVQRLLRAAVHKNNWHLPGAQLFHILSQGPKLVAPMNNAS